MTETTADSFIDFSIRHNGLLYSNVLDSGTRFASAFWSKLILIFQKISHGYVGRPYTDGQMKRVQKCNVQICIICSVLKFVSATRRILNQQCFACFHRLKPIFYTRDILVFLHILVSQLRSNRPFLPRWGSTEQSHFIESFDKSL